MLQCSHPVMESAQLGWWRHQSAEGGSVAVPALCSLLAILVFVALYVNLQALEQSKKLPPGPRGWPVVGNLPDLTKFGPPHRSLATLAAKYGGLMYLRLGIYMCLHTLELVKHPIVKRRKSTPLHRESKAFWCRHQKPCHGCLCICPAAIVSLNLRLIVSKLYVWRLIRNWLFSGFISRMKISGFLEICSFILQREETRWQG